MQWAILDMKLVKYVRDKMGLTVLSRYPSDALLSDLNSWFSPSNLYLS
jgi:hypothetical protein